MPLVGGMLDPALRAVAFGLRVYRACQQTPASRSSPGRSDK